MMTRTGGAAMDYEDCIRAQLHSLNVAYALAHGLARRCVDCGDILPIAAQCTACAEWAGHETIVKQRARWAREAGEPDADGVICGF